MSRPIVMVVDLTHSLMLSLTRPTLFAKKSASGRIATLSTTDPLR